ncbi:hypothetical protein DRF59_08225 [Chryseobacterium flavum]|uniref:NadR/Ttd14 AAA domain-containing protein n=1 Tax=Chryseobacterium flavum TaxID=415851 RepID=A0A3D9CPB7_9FLAO|nr:hypothetical protein [Chryseobacterium flavum]REC67612.1 hypothetical protein DRF59_08225 [Chryseobacterium flavum]
MKLAIVIEGAQSSGKTSTILHFINQYQNRKLNVMRSGWQNIFINPHFQNLKINPYVISSSPSESDKQLIQRFNKWSILPDLIIMAEQNGGKHYSNTMTFLNANGYSINTFVINNINGSLNWERFDSSNKAAKLTTRANEIMDSIIFFIKTNNII